MSEAKIESFLFLGCAGERGRRNEKVQVVMQMGQDITNKKGGIFGRYDYKWPFNLSWENLEKIKEIKKRKKVKLMRECKRAQVFLSDLSGEIRNFINNI